MCLQKLNGGGSGLEIQLHKRIVVQKNVMTTLTMMNVLFNV